MRVLILGGYGFFGRRLASRLAHQRGLSLIIAGRTAATAEALARRLQLSATAEISWQSLDADASDLQHRIAEIRPDVLVNVAGPFQGKDYHVAEACIAEGVHYIDLADSRSFVCGIHALDARARRAGVMVVSGASSVPALSSAVADDLAASLAAVESIDIGISPGNRTERGLSTVQGILSYCGRAIDTPGQEGVVAWSGTRSHRYLPPVGERLLSPCDVPDLALLPNRYAGAPVVRFRAGLELRFLHRGMNVMAWLAHQNWVGDWSRHAPVLKAMSDWFVGWGSEDGAMHVRVHGRDAAQNLLAREWQLIASAGDGPYVPTLAASALVHRLVQGSPVPTGAMPCVGLLTVQDILAQAAGLSIHTTKVQPQSLFRSAMGAAYERLDPTVRAFHELQGRTELLGVVEVEPPQTVLARLLAWLLGSPRQGGAGPLRFELRSAPDRETWVRHFPGRTMRSRMSLAGGELVEHLGPARVTFDLRESAGVLVMRLRALRFFGVPCPGWLLPRVEATEHGEAGRLCFDILASVPWVGRVAAYRGYLQVDASRKVAA